MNTILAFLLKQIADILLGQGILQRIIDRDAEKGTCGACRVMRVLALLLLVMGSAADAACRSPTMKHRFDVEQSYPHGRKGYVVDHVCALACGGIDDPKNMQYQTYKDGKLKDKWERTPEGCKNTCTPDNSTPNRQVYNCKGMKK